MCPAPQPTQKAPQTGYVRLSTAQTNERVVTENQAASAAQTLTLLPLLPSSTVANLTPLLCHPLSSGTPQWFVHEPCPARPVPQHPPWA